MSSFVELKYWANGIRTIEVFETQKQADSRRSFLRKAGSKTPIVSSSVHSSHCPIKEFREIRKRKDAEATR